LLAYFRRRERFRTSDPYLIKVGAQVFIVGVGEGGFTKLGEIPAADLPPVFTRRTPFADTLARAVAKRPSVERE
jgi:hypothetical protein